MKEFIDAFLFLGMHSYDENKRIACKNFFVERFSRQQPVWISLEQVGFCDHIIWGFKRSLQDLYYPFMDRLHSEMDIRRIPYSKKHVSKISSDFTFDRIEDIHHFLCLMVICQNGTLYTTQNLENIDSMQERIKHPIFGRKELFFPRELEDLYQDSLTLRVHCEFLREESHLLYGT